ncbi:hypothetical protein [Azotobacter salinestris]|uniref:hypothetical protein n=1 Tax=Azotobacter salinestris TaxID=69964 RepID=UPI001266A64F|nr:hypothetical protein [Azotobacter salinestris]
MKTKVALHRAQDLGKACDALRAKEAIRIDVGTYLEWRDLQNNAIDDDEPELAGSIGRSMKALRLQHDTRAWEREMAAQGA